MTMWIDKTAAQTLLFKQTRLFWPSHSFPSPLYRMTECLSMIPREDWSLRSPWCLCCCRGRAAEEGLGLSSRGVLNSAVNANTPLECFNWQASVFLDACQFIRLDVCLLNCSRHGHKFLCNQHLSFRDKTLIKKVPLYHNFADTHD